MAHLYYYDSRKIDVGYAYALRDFLADKKDIERLESLTDVTDQLIFVEDVTGLFIFRYKKEILDHLKEIFKDNQITEYEFRILQKKIKKI